MQRRTAGLTRFYAPASYTPPAWAELRSRVEYIRLARVAAGLPATEARRLIRVARSVARETAEKAEWSLPFLRAVRWDSVDSIRDALVRLHEAAGYDLLGSVTIFDPRVRRFFGAGLPPGGVPVPS